MNQQEFIERTGYTPATSDEYKRIEAMYMAAGDMDKDEFCREWKKMHDNPLFRKVYEQLELVSYMYNKQESVINKAFEMVLDKANEVDAHEDFDEIACVLKLRKSVIRYKLTHNYELTEDDKEYIKTLL